MALLSGSSSFQEDLAACIPDNWRPPPEFAAAFAQLSKRIVEQGEMDLASQQAPHALHNR